VACIAAINRACLVYDGRLVIDASFHTNDVSVRAAGPLTKYQRRYYTELTHADFNSKEIGTEVSGDSYYRVPTHTHTQPFYGPLGSCPGLSR